MESSLISIIIPTYNHGYLLGEALDSVLSQTYSNWECIIVDDGSTDDTKEIVFRYINKDIRFRYALIQKAGPSSARNVGLKMAKGDFIQFLDADDLISKNKFEVQLGLFHEKKSDVIVCRMIYLLLLIENYFDDNMSSKVPALTLNGFIYSWDIDFVIAIHSPLISHDFIKRNKLKFREEIKAKVDWVFWIELALNNATFYFHPDKLAHYRRHSSNMTSDKIHMILNNFRAIFLVYDLLSEEQRIQFRELMPMPLMLKSKELLEVTTLEMKITELKHSLNYKLGTFILRPYRFIKNGIFRKNTNDVHC